MERNTQIPSEDLPHLPHFCYPEPDFPFQSFADKLPSAIATENFQSHCICPPCAPALWKDLPEHPSKLKLRSTGLETIVEFVREHCLNLQNLTLQNDSVLSKHMRSFHSAFTKLQNATRESVPNYEKYPSLVDLAEPLNQIFFGDVLKDITYTWIKCSGVQPKLMGYHRPAKVSDEVGLRDEIFIYPAHPSILPRSSFGAITSDKDRISELSAQYSAAQIARTILHEQVHAMLYSYSCHGRCKSSQDPLKKALCSHLNNHMIYCWSKVRYQNRYWKRSTEIDEFKFHGPAFWEILHTLFSVAEKQLGVKLYIYDRYNITEWRSLMARNKPRSYAKWEAAFGVNLIDEESYKKEHPECWCRYGITPLFAQLILKTDLDRQIHAQASHEPAITGHSSPSISPKPH